MTSWPGCTARPREWLGEHGFAVEAVRQAQAAQDWDLAARLLFDHWFGLVLDGQAATADELLGEFPAGPVAADARADGAAGGPRAEPGIARRR